MAKIIKFEKEHCNPCFMVERELTALGVASEVEHINPFEDPDTAIAYDVTMSVPVTLLVRDDGEVIRRVEGFDPDGLNALVTLYKMANA